MQIPPEITLKGIETTPYIDRLISRGIASLEQVCDYIVSTHIALELAQNRHRTGNYYRMRINVRLPHRREVVVKRHSTTSRIPGDPLAELQAKQALAGEVEPETERPLRRSPIPARRPREEPLLALIRRGFASTRRELQRAVEKQRGEVKRPAQQQETAMVEKIFRDRQYGFLRTLDGQQVYFHMNSVLHDHWERLKPGVAVRYSPEMGDQGLQASSVELLNKPGALEMHDRLHDLAVPS